MNEGIWSGGTGGGPEALLEFKAGQCFRQGKMIHPSKDKGKVQLSLQDGLLHLKWLPRPSGKAAHDLMLFKGDAKFERIHKVEDGRVFVLKFSSNKEFFYWLQEPKTDRDEYYLKRVNELIDNPRSKDSDADEQNRIKEQQKKMMSEFNKKKDEKNTQQNTGGGFSIDSFNETLKSLGMGEINKNDAKKGGNMQSVLNSFMKKGIKLNDVLNRSFISQVLKNDESLCKELVKFLPEGTECTPKAIEEHLRSPQFTQAIKTIDMALGTMQVDGKMLGLDVPSKVYDVEQILRILQSAYEKKKEDEKK